LILAFLFVLANAFSVQTDTSEVAFADAAQLENNGSSTKDVIALPSSATAIEAETTTAKYFQGDIVRLSQENHETQQPSQLSDPPSFSRHLMCKGFDLAWNPIEPTTIFRPSDISAVCLTTVSINETIEFKWNYRSNSSRDWVSCYNWNKTTTIPGTYPFAGWLNISGFWPGHNYPKAYKVDVHLDSSPSPAFSEFFEITNGGLNSPRICKGFDVNGNPINITSRFTKGVDTKAYHYLRFDKIAYLNEELGICHNFTTVWVQPNGSVYKTYSANFTDYKDTDLNRNYWEYNYTRNNYIDIDTSTPAGSWKVEVYLDTYCFNNISQSYGPVATTPFTVGSAPVKDWTFMVYLDADNNLEEAGIDLFLKLSSVGATDDVNVVVQMDRIPGYDSRYGAWTDVKRFNVTKGLTPTAANATEWISENLANMGDPNTLRDFVNWATINYPANYYFLALWDHGAGYVGTCFDYTSGDYLTLPEISQALSGLQAIIDVVFLDACSMSMTEVAYQIKDYANVLIGPEGLGYQPAPYENYLTDLTSDPSTLPTAFAEKVVTRYVNWCNSRSDITNATMAATDLTKITTLMAAIDDFATKLKEKETPYLSLLLSSHDQIILARNLTEEHVGPYTGDTGNYTDLYHFAQLARQLVLDEELQDAADQVMTAFSVGNTIIKAANKSCANSHGLSIFFPKRRGQGYNSLETEYNKTDFAKDSTWDKFVKYHVSGCILTIKTPFPGISAKIDEKPFATDVNGTIRVFVLPNSYTINVATPISTGPNSRESFARWSDLDPSNPRTLLVNAALTLVAEYETQYYVTIDQSGSTATVNASIDTVTVDLPQSLWWTKGSMHNVSVALTANAASDIRYKFTQWNDSSSNSLKAITVTGSTTYTAYYKTQCRVVFSQTGVGFDFEGTVVTIDGTGYNTTLLPVPLWWDNGSAHTFTFRSPLVVVPNAKQYAWNYTNGLSSQESEQITVSTPGDIVGNYRTQYLYYLAVTSLYGTLTPTSGWFEAGKPITVSVTSPVSGPTGTRFVSTGWTGTGSIPASGTTASVTFTFDQPSSITWTWKTQYLLTVHTDPAGISPEPSVSPAGPWFDNDTQVTCTAQKIDGRLFERWTVDGTSWDVGVNPITIVMNEPSEATAHYIRETAWWETLLRPDIVQVILGAVGIVVSVAFVGIAWVRTRRGRGVVKAFLTEIDNVYSRLKDNPSECEKQLSMLRNTILEGVTDGKITQESYEVMNTRIDKCLEELHKKRD